MSFSLIIIISWLQGASRYRFISQYSTVITVKTTVNYISSYSLY